MATVFWDVDTQHDFMLSSGKLYVSGSEEIIPVLRRLTDYAHARGIRIIASADDHVPVHHELSATPDWRETFPEHCMRGTPGQRKIPETALRNPLLIEPEPQDPAALVARVRAHDGDILFHKHWFDVFSNPNLLPVVDALGPTDIVLYGVALDVCDKYAIEGLLQHRPRIPLTLVTDAVRAIDPKAGATLLEDWRRRGVRLASSAEILAV
ncbi:MAG TPA: cysteine hydrolase family protein [Gemmatimonadales bacterium]|jgi:nicotinamidase-related amidase|nr:cysteine hydrolase family protein [Gemmatimonadales bacterium]